MDSKLTSYETHLKGSAYHAVNAILLRNAIREDHTDFSGKIKAEGDSSGIVFVTKPIQPTMNLDKRPLHSLYLMIDHPTKTTGGGTMTMVMEGPAVPPCPPG